MSDDPGNSAVARLFEVWCAATGSRDGCLFVETLLDAMAQGVVPESLQSYLELCRPVWRRP